MSSSPRASSMAARSTSSPSPSRNAAGTVRFADTDRRRTRFRAALTPKTKAIFVESIANPGGIITDLDAVCGGRQGGRRSVHRRQYARHALSDPADRARRRHRRAFADQVPRRARQLDRRRHRRLRHVRLDRRAGATRRCRRPRRPITASPSPRPSAISPSPSPAACWACAISAPPSRRSTRFLILTGIETLPLRMQRHCDNALAVAEWLSRHTTRSRG